MQMAKNKYVNYISINVLLKEAFLAQFCKGIYAISVAGRLPAGIQREMKSRGIIYKPRDTSQR